MGTTGKLRKFSSQQKFRFLEHKLFDSFDIYMNIIVTKNRWRFKCLRAKLPPRRQHCIEISGYTSCESGDIKYLICHMTSQVHVIEVSWGVMSGSLS